MENNFLFTCASMIIIKVEKSSIIDVNHNFTDYIEVIEDSYQLENISVGTAKGSEESLRIWVTFKILQDCSSFEFEENGFYLVPTNKDGDAIVNDQEDEVKMTSLDMDDYCLLASPVGNRRKVSFSYTCPNKDVKKKILNNINNFDIYTKAKIKVTTNIETSSTSFRMSMNNLQTNM